jgi:hypothetical protein
MQMKHGDKAKAKAAKASKPSDKKSSSKAASKKGGGSKAVPKSSAKKAGSSEKGTAKKAGGEVRGAPAAKIAANGRGRSAGDDAVSFANPVIAAAFKRAVKKYPNSFRRLTD